MSADRRWPAPWVFSLLILPLGMVYGFNFTALPFLLAKAGVPVDRIARVSAINSLPGVLGVLIAPIVDIKLRRRTWLAIGIFGTAIAACISLALLSATATSSVFFSVALWSPLASGINSLGVALHGETLAKFALLWGAAFLLLGFAEEFAYRGYSQATLTGGMGFWPAAVLLWAFLGAVHYFFKPMEYWMDSLSVGLFGLFWCFTLRRTGTLWFAIGFHAMSNYADMVLFAQPNTGNNGQSLTGHLLNVSYHGPEWLTGGPRGTEASALEFLVLALLFLAFARAYPRIAAGVPISE